MTDVGRREARAGARPPPEAPGGGEVHVDGGVNRETAALVGAQGTDALVVGSALFKSRDMAREIELVRALADDGYRAAQAAGRAETASSRVDRARDRRAGRASRRGRDGDAGRAGGAGRGARSPQRTTAPRSGRRVHRPPVDSHDRPGRLPDARRAARRARTCRGAPRPGATLPPGLDSVRRAVLRLRAHARVRRQLRRGDPRHGCPGRRAVRVPGLPPDAGPPGLAPSGDRRRPGRGGRDDLLLPPLPVAPRGRLLPLAATAKRVLRLRRRAHRPVDGRAS